MANKNKSNSKLPFDLEDEISDKIIDSVSYVNRESYVNIDGEISEPSKYREVFSLLRKAKAIDRVIFRINSIGGLTDTAIQLVNAIQNTSAYCVAEIYAAYSSGSIIALACDRVIPMKFSSMMIHNMSWGSGGKVNEITVHSDFMKKYGNNIMHSIYKGFLSKEEIKSVLTGTDIWLTESDIKKRLKNWTPMRKVVEE